MTSPTPNTTAQHILEASKRLNLVSTGDQEKIFSKHLPDSLEALALEDFSTRKEPWMDLGSGGGFPSLILASLCPETPVHLVDSRLKKCEALRDIAREAGLHQVQVHAQRLEELALDPDFRENFSLITARALAPLPLLLEYAAPFLRPSGRLLAWKGSRFQEEIEASQSQLLALGLRITTVHAYTLEDEPEVNRVILVVEKM